MPHTLPSLPYAFDALEPHIDARTMEIHHGKHHAAYVANLNKALEATGSAGLTELEIVRLLRNLKEVPEAQRTAVRNNGGGHYNHSLFWMSLAPRGGGRPTGPLAKAIETTFGSFEAFQTKFEEAAMGRFGSGWAWLTYGTDGTIAVGSTPNQDNPIIEATGTPLLGLDVWEHAYYLQYQNRRAEYVKAFWSLVDWSEIGRRYATCKA
ncbi:MAG: superoxide dismutase [Deltaproteobacteria bacterium]|nr:superoxide dismutase [Deltaproteobacteria bacterium]